MISALKVFSERLLQKSFLFYLEQDATYYQDLQPLQGKEILFYVRDLHLLISFQFTRTTVKIQYQKKHTAPCIHDETHLCLEGLTTNLLAFAIRAEQRSRLLSEVRVTYQGDLFLLEALVKLVKERDFLENVPLPAAIKALLLKGTHRTCAWQKQNLQVLKNTVLDYVTEELALLPSAKHFELSQAVLIDLEGVLDRLEAKMGFLQET